ncbi:hypothetical protein V8C37DRAFT_420326 [Trichoderma ceciliae]
MELISRLLLVGLVLTCFANAISSDLVDRSNPSSTPSWRGSALLSYVSSEEAYQTPPPSSNEYSSLEPYSFYDTWFPLPSIPVSLMTPRPQYSTIVNPGRGRNGDGDGPIIPSFVCNRVWLSFGIWKWMFVFVFVLVVNFIVCERCDNYNVVAGSNCLSFTIDFGRRTRKSGFDINNFLSVNDNNNNNQGERNSTCGAVAALLAVFV